MPLTDEDIREILRLVDEAEVDELRIETEGLSLYVRRGGGEDPAPVQPPAPARKRQSAAPAPSEEPAASGSSGARAGAAPSEQLAGDVTAAAADGALTITAPMLGTFYRAEAPGAPPFVDLGTRVEPDAVVCLIEVMKMMNSVPAGVSGTVVEICAENAEVVEPGAPLFRVAPE
ncbi:MAG: hypothetical protein JO372_06410 [Solirubrobacterales bacterium]|nr:hypothetical protein [Solirubrobacterales bacterium]